MAKKEDFVQCVKTVLTRHYADAEVLHIVLDNLNTHFAKCFYDILPKEEADLLLSRIQFHYTPKHGSWLNMAEPEIGILDRQCIKGRVPSEESLTSRVNVWVADRNEKKAKISWSFTREKADAKLGKHYVD